MKRGGYMQRHTPMPRSKISTSAGARHLRVAPSTISPEDQAHLARVRLLPCCAHGLPGHVCGGRVVAHHAGRHGIGIKSPHIETIPICWDGHRNLHEHTECFAPFSKAEMRSWEDGQVAVTQRTLGVATDPFPF